jgi:cell division septation protein DedD
VRWVFYTLLVANLVYLGWHLTADRLERTPLTSSSPPAAKGAEAGSASSLALLSEQPQPGKAALAAPSSSQAASCTVVGPWSDSDEARRARIQLRAAGLAGRIEPVRVEKDRLNWVYLPPFESRQRALEALNELQALGVDSFIVKEGDYANAISLGYFSSAESAEGLRTKMRNAGYPVFVRETAREVTEYWIYLPPSEDGGAALADFLVGNPQASRSQSQCPGNARWEG